jgi:3-oxoacyl-[acyl-carrier protein] reductase
MDLQLDNKCALVTGASRGLGYATARRLALEGCRVAINSRDPQAIHAAADDIQQHSSQEIVPLMGDVSDPTTAHQLVHRAAESLL